MDNQSFNIEGLDGILDSLQRLPKEISTKRGGPVRAALRKGGHVFRDEMRRNVNRITATPNLGDVDNESTGLLAKSIGTTRGKKMVGGEQMKVTVRKRARYPASIKSPKRINVGLVGWLLEYGGPRNPNPHPWARPAFHAKKQEAVRVTVTELRKGVDKAIKKVSKP